MCGLFAWWPKRPAPSDVARVRRGMAALAPRGPDGEHLWSCPHGAAHLAHRRLAITGLRGAQPLWSPDGSVALLVNGEFYDAAEQRRFWERQGHRFAGDTDSELLLPLYARYGERALDRLEGEFAFVLWDRARQTVWMGRDRAGVKPLRVACDERGLAAASEAKALVAAGWPSRWDETALAEALALQYPSPDRTLFDGIGQLEPGESRAYALRPCGGWERTSRRWWRWFPHAAEELVRPDPQAAARELEEALVGAVSRRTDTAWPLAVHLSGGLDSSAILALAARQSKNVQAFSVQFENAGGEVQHDESRVAQKTAVGLRVSWTPVPVSRAQMLAHWGDAVERAEAFAVNGHGVAKWLLARAVSEAGFRVVLTGEGSDEALLGYPFLAAEAGDAIDAHALWRANPVAHGSMLPDGAGIDLARVHEAWGFVPTWLTAKAVLGARLSSLMRPEWGRERLPAAVGRWADAEPSNAAAPPVHRAAAAWARRALGGYILPALADAPEAGFGIEGRVPFLDRAVLEVTARWAPETTGWPHTSKAPLRRLVHEWGLPHVALRPKHPFEAPPLWGDPFVRAALRRQWSDAQVWCGTPFCPKAIAHWMDRMDVGSAQEHQRWEPVVATLLSVMHWNALWNRNERGSV